MELKKQDKKLALTLPVQVQVEPLTEKDMSVVTGGGGTNNPQKAPVLGKTSCFRKDSSSSLVNGLCCKN